MIQVGSRVRHSSAFKAFALTDRRLSWETVKEYQMTDGFLRRLQEFEDCEGIVIGHPAPDWPEWDVRWIPSGLRYAYIEEWLEEIGTK